VSLRTLASKFGTSVGMVHLLANRALDRITLSFAVTLE
jgi:hypothetical protein